MAACGNTNTNPSEKPGTENNQNSEKPETDVVKEAAMGYFANFADDRNIISTANLLKKIDAKEATQNQILTMATAFENKIEKESSEV